MVPPDKMQVEVLLLLVMVMGAHNPQVVLVDREAIKMEQMVQHLQVVLVELVAPTVVVAGGGGSGYFGGGGGGGGVSNGNTGAGVVGGGGSGYLHPSLVTNGTTTQATSNSRIETSPLTPSIPGNASKGNDDGNSISTPSAAYGGLGCIVIEFNG